MAGGKETPRQKMIGMMYLVLIALLALQIKDTVLEKFVLMEAGLQSSNAVYEASSRQIVQSISKAAQDQGGKESDIKVKTFEATEQFKKKNQISLYNM